MRTPLTRAVIVQVTLQYCMWDQFKEVATAPPRRAANLARFLAVVIANFGLSISLFKVNPLAACPESDAKARAVGIHIGGTHLGGTL